MKTICAKCGKKFEDRYYDIINKRLGIISRLPKGVLYEVPIKILCDNCIKKIWRNRKTK